MQLKYDNENIILHKPPRFIRPLQKNSKIISEWVATEQLLALFTKIFAPRKKV